MISLRKATYEDCPLIHSIQVRSFIGLLQKYNDFESSPAAESLDKIQQRFQQPYTDYYLIESAGETVGMLRVCDFGVNCRLSPICILPEYRGRNYARQAISAMEQLYPDRKTWQLDTIAQEEYLCRIYESVGYRKTGKTENLKAGMDLVFYEKKMSE